MVFDANLVPNLFNLPIGPNDERGAYDAHEFPAHKFLFLPHTVILQHLQALIRKKREGKLVFFLEAFVALHRVRADAQNHRAFFLNRAPVVPEVTGFLGAARGHVLGIKIKHDGFSLEVLQGYLLSLVIVQ